MTEKPLYEDSQIKIDYLPGSIEDHTLLIKPDGEYILPQGCLREFATTSRDKIEMKIRTLNELIVCDAVGQRLDIDSLGLAIAQAYIEEERRRESLRIQFEIEKKANEDF